MSQYGYLVILVSLFVWCESAFSWSFGKGHQRGLQNPRPHVEADSIIARIEHPAPEVHQRVREFVKNLRTAPTCARRAAYGLVSDCANLADQSEASQKLDHVKTAYAARLAVCELQGAGLLVPQECEPEVIENVNRRFLGANAEPWMGASRCAKALEARPQSWTSYSNNRQNALLICRASRIEADRDNMLALFASLAKNNEASEEALRSWLEFSEEQLAEKQNLATQLQMLVESLPGKIQKEAAKVADEFSSTHGRLSALQSEFVSTFTAVLQKTSGDAQFIIDALENARMAMFTSLSELQTQGSEMTLQRQRDLEATSMIALNLKEGLANLFERQDTLRVQIDTMQVNLQVAADRQEKAATGLLRKSETALDRLIRLESSALTIADAFSSLLRFKETIISWSRWTGLTLHLFALLLMLRFLGIVRNWGLSRSILGALLLTTAWRNPWNIPRLLDIYHFLTEAVLPQASLIVTFSLLAFSFGSLLLRYLYQRLSTPRTSINGQQKGPEEPNCQNSSAAHQPGLIIRFYDPITEEYVDDYAEIHDRWNSPLESR